MRGVALEPVHDLVGRHRRRERAEQVYVIGLNREIQHLAAQFSGLCCAAVRRGVWRVASTRTLRRYFRYPDEVVVDVVGGVSGSFAVHKRIMPQFVWGVQTNGETGGCAQFPIPAKAGSTLAPFLWERERHEMETRELCDFPPVGVRATTGGSCAAGRGLRPQHPRSRAYLLRCAQHGHSVTGPPHTTPTTGKISIKLFAVCLIH